MKKTLTQLVMATIGILTTSSIVLVACIVGILITFKK